MPGGRMLGGPVRVRALAAEPPWWPPGSGHGDHVNVFGFLAGEVIRRVTGITVGAMLRDEIAGPLGADVHIGLPAAQHGRVAEFIWPEPGSPPGPEAIGEDQRMILNAYFNPPGLSGLGVCHTAAWREAEVPAAHPPPPPAGGAPGPPALAGGGAPGRARGGRPPGARR